MKESRRSIFRDDAIRRYVASREQSVLPRWVSPWTFLYLWLLLGLLGVSSLIAWFVRVPVYASGSAVVVRWQNKKQGTGNDIVVAAFFPPQTLANLRANQKVLLHFDGMGNRFTRTILTVEPAIRSPDSVQKQFALNPSSAQAIAQPVAVVIARWEPVPTELPASAYLGSLGRAEVEIGSQRAISLLPNSFN